MYVLAVIALSMFYLNCVMGDCNENQRDVIGDGSQCCTKCPPGQGATSPCTLTNDTTCGACTDSETYSSIFSDKTKCVECLQCIKNSHVIEACSVTHDTKCECDDNFYYDYPSNECRLCTPCDQGSGMVYQCTRTRNTECRSCPQNTYSDVLSPLAGCLLCTLCRSTQIKLQECNPKQDTVCLDMSEPNPTVQLINAPLSNKIQSSGGTEIDVIPLYCALLGAVVIGLLAYVIFKNIYRGKDKGVRLKSQVADVEYGGSAVNGDSGCYMEREQKSITLKTKIRDVPPSRRKEVEKCLGLPKEKAGDWRTLARELGYNRTKLSSFETRAALEHLEPVSVLFSEWSKSVNATVGVLVKLLKKMGRQDAIQALFGDVSELVPLTNDIV